MYTNDNTSRIPDVRTSTMSSPPVTARKRERQGALSETFEGRRETLGALARQSVRNICRAVLRFPGLVGSRRLCSPQVVMRTRSVSAVRPYVSIVRGLAADAAEIPARTCHRRAATVATHIRLPCVDVRPCHCGNRQDRLRARTRVLAAAPL